MRMSAHHLMPLSSSSAGLDFETKPGVNVDAAGNVDSFSVTKIRRLRFRRHHVLLQGSCIEDISSAVRSLEDLHPNHRLLFLAHDSLDDTSLVPSIYRGVVSSIDLEDRFEQLNYCARQLSRHLNSIGLPASRLDDFQRWALLQASSDCRTPVIRLSCSIESARVNARQAACASIGQAAMADLRISVLAFPATGGSILTNRRLRFDHIPRVFFDSLNLSGDVSDVYVGRPRRSSRLADSLLNLNDLSRYRVAQIRLPERWSANADSPSGTCGAVDATERDSGIPSTFAAAKTLL